MEEYIGIPWVQGERSFRGATCWGLVQLFYEAEYGIVLPGYESKDFGLHQWIQVDSAKEGDVLLFRVAGMGRHVGIALNDALMLHVDERTTSRIEPYRGMVWKNRLLKIYRHRQLA